MKRLPTRRRSSAKAAAVKKRWGKVGGRVEGMKKKDRLGEAAKAFERGSGLLGY